MKPLQPILDMLERAENPRARTMEAMKPKPVKANDSQVWAVMNNTFLTFSQEQIIRQQMFLQQQQAAPQGLAGLLGRGF